MIWQKHAEAEFPVPFFCHSHFLPSPRPLSFNSCLSLRLSPPEIYVRLLHAVSRLSSGAVTCQTNRLKEDDVLLKRAPAVLPEPLLNPVSYNSTRWPRALGECA